MLVTLIFALLAWRYVVRLEVASHTSMIQNQGGRVIYAWQNPRIEIEMLTSSIRPRPVPVSVLRYDLSQKPPLNILDVISGQNSDIQVGLVIVPADQIDKETVSKLQDMPKLKSLMYWSSEDQGDRTSIDWINNCLN